MKNGPEDCAHPEICPTSLGRKRTEIRHSVPPLQEVTGNPWLQATQNNSKPNPVLGNKQKWPLLSSSQL